MMINYFGKNRNMKKAVKIANTFLSGSGLFYSKISEVDMFAMSDASTKHIIELMKDVFLHESIEVIEFKHWWYFSKMIAKFDPSEPSLIQMRKKFNNRSVHSLVGTIIHEYVHVVDNRSPLSFGHGSNSRVGKNTTAPYYIGSLAKELSIKHF